MKAGNSKLRRQRSEMPDPAMYRSFAALRMTGGGGVVILLGSGAGSEDLLLPRIELPHVSQAPLRAVFHYSRTAGALQSLRLESLQPVMSENQTYTIQILQMPRISGDDFLEMQKDMWYFRPFANEI